jgi:RNA polymerase sigma-70 factor (ECF subfamily)
MEALYSFALYLCRNREVARDLVQETYLRAWEHWEQFQPGTNCKAWLFTILRNLYINLYRKQQRAGEMVEYDEAETESEQSSVVEQAATPSVEAEFYRSLLDEEVQQALAALPEQYRTVVILCDLEDFTYEEIAQMLGIPIGTVRSRLHRARLRLATLLETYARQRGWTR